MKKEIRILITLCVFGACPSCINAQSNTVGLIMNDSTASYNGYTLFAPMTSTNTYLIDNQGYLIHSWSSAYRPGLGAMLLPDGSLLRTAFLQKGNSFNAGGSGGRIERYDWDGNLIWSFNYCYPDSCTNHDVAYMPDGDLLMISWERKSYADAVAAGRNPSNLGSDLWSEKIIEVKPTGTSGGKIVWEWHVWDHLIQDYDSTKSNYGSVSAHPELIDLNFGSADEDWLHINSIRYNPGLDEILISTHNLSEIWVIDHSTSTAEAAGHTGGKRGHGGDILYRWGNPQAYGAGSQSDQKLYYQHDARWIDSGLPGAGDIMIFNNGKDRPEGDYSTIEEITPPIDSNGNYYLENSGAYGPDTVTWEYKANPANSFYSSHLGGEDRLPNGNTLICEGVDGRFFEVDSSGNIVWEYINPVSQSGIVAQGDTPQVNMVFKIYRYSAQYSGLAGKDLSRKGKIEQYPMGIENNNSQITGFILNQNYPNPFNPNTTINYQLSTGSNVTLKVYDILGNLVNTLVNGYKDKGRYKVNFNGSKLSSGVYLYRLVAGRFTDTKKLILMK